MKEPKYRRPLNYIQKDILLILYKFRFASIELIDSYLGIKDSKYSYVRLATLVEQKYIGRNFSEEDKINRKPATYYLLLDGIKVLKTIPDLNKKAFANASRDHRADPGFIERCLFVFKLYNKLRALYGDELEFYSKSEASEYDIFPRTLPDAYLIMPTRRYMLEWLPPSTNYPAIRGRLNRLIAHYKNGNWKAVDPQYPTILFVCDNSYIERQTLKIAKRSIQKAEDIDFDDMPMRTTTTKALFASPSKDVPIWSDIEDPEELVTM